MSGAYYHAQPLVKMESHEVFIQAGLEKQSLISASQVAEIAGLSYHTF
jgi:hypothetical protein